MTWAHGDQLAKPVRSSVCTMWLASCWLLRLASEVEFSHFNGGERRQQQQQRGRGVCVRRDGNCQIEDMERTPQVKIGHAVGLRSGRAAAGGRAGLELEPCGGGDPELDMD